jgi:large subunit ribosomal protein L35
LVRARTPAVHQLPIGAGSAISATFAARLNRAAVATPVRVTFYRSENLCTFNALMSNFADRTPSGAVSCCGLKESQMPKLKTKSGAKKRFKVTANGKVMYAQRGKRHGMIKRTTKQIRQLRGTRVLFKTDGDNVKKYFLPNA